MVDAEDDGGERAKRARLNQEASPHLQRAWNNKITNSSNHNATETTLNLFAREGHRFDARNLVAAAFRAARSRGHVPGLDLSRDSRMKKLADAVRLRLGELDSKDLSRAVRAFASAKVEAHDLYAGIADAAKPRLADYNLENLARLACTLAWTLERARAGVPPFFDAVADAVCRAGVDKFTDRDLDRILIAFPKVDVYRSDLFEAVAQARFRDFDLNGQAIFAGTRLYVAEFNNAQGLLKWLSEQAALGHLKNLREPDAGHDEDDGAEPRVKSSPTVRRPRTPAKFGSDSNTADSKILKLLRSRTTATKKSEDDKLRDEDDHSCVAYCAARLADGKEFTFKLDAVDDTIRLRLLASLFVDNMPEDTESTQIARMARRFEDCREADDETINLVARCWPTYRRLRYTGRKRPRKFRIIKNHNHTESKLLDRLAHIKVEHADARISEVKIIGTKLCCRQCAPMLQDAGMDVFGLRENSDQRPGSAIEKFVEDKDFQDTLTRGGYHVFVDGLLGISRDNNEALTSLFYAETNEHFKG